MSRTRRIYNKPRLKKTQRQRWVTSEVTKDGFEIRDNGRSSLTGFPYHPYHQMCMGRCPSCRNPQKNRRLIRKRIKESFRMELREELTV